MTPNPDDFTIARDCGATFVSFGPTGACYRVSITRTGQREVRQVLPPRGTPGEYADKDVHDMAVALAARNADAGATRRSTPPDSFNNAKAEVSMGQR